MIYTEALRKAICLRVPQKVKTGNKQTQIFFGLQHAFSSKQFDSEDTAAQNDNQETLRPPPPGPLQLFFLR